MSIPSPTSRPPDADEARLSFTTIQQANKAFAAGSYLEARELCTKALIEYTPYHPVAYANRACMYSKLGYHDLAAGDAYKAVMLMEYVRAVIEGLEEESDEEDRAEGKDAGANGEQERAQGATEAEAMAEEADADGRKQADDSDEEGEPASIFTHIAQAAFSTVSSFLKLSNNIPANEDGEIRRADLKAFVDKFDRLASFYLINSLRQCSSLLDAYEFCESTLKRYKAAAGTIGAVAVAAPPTDTVTGNTGAPGEELQITTASFETLKVHIMEEMNMKLEKALETQKKTGDISPEKSRTILSSGIARRQKYPWNNYEPDRFSEKTLAALNASMWECGERALGKGTVKCEAKVVDLPDLTMRREEKDGKLVQEARLSRHLGIFATQDIYEGEVFFEERTTISGSPYPGRRVLCDYCAERLVEGKMFTCEKCPKTSAAGRATEQALYPAYCSVECLAMAAASHHPTLCGKEDDLSWIYDDIVSSPNPISMYSTLLIKLFAMALHRNKHPLELPETVYLYGAAEPERNLTMRWDFVSCVVRPIWVLTQGLGVDIYSSEGIANFDTWVVNTLMAKVMGTCSGRFEPALGLSQECDDRPDVVNVHPTWSFVNHDCEPNVGWKPEGRGRFWGMAPRAYEGPGGRELVCVRAGQEVKSCYTDRKLSYKVRREWARDMLGGDCQCKRCVKEELEDQDGRDGERKEIEMLVRKVEEGL